MKAPVNRYAILILSAASLGTIAAHAQSSVTLYGVVDDSLAYVNNQQGHSNVYMRDGNLYASKFGLRGDEDLGGGTHAIFDLQSGFNLNNGAQSAAGLIFNRQAFVGLRNDHYGTMTAGRQYTPYFLFVGPYASSSGRRMLDTAAVAAVKRWTFVPAKRGDEAVDGWVNVPIDFKLG